LTPRRVRFTATARRHVQREKQWWLENRIYTEVFAAEFEQALRVLALLPGAGTSYPQAGIPGLRRIYVAKVACHLYYTFDEDQVIVRAFWGAHRGRRPRLNP
jgi:plasmid stabilization system protein ParE